MNEPEAEQPHSPFDLNQDGTIDGRDIALAMNYYMLTDRDHGWDETAKRCDMNGDGKIDIIDLVLIYACIAWDDGTQAARHG